MRERVELERGQRDALSRKFGISQQLVSYALSFSRNSRKSRELRSYAVNVLGFKVNLLPKHLI